MSHPATTEPPLATPRLDIEKVRADFPILRRLVHGKPLAYLDNASSSQRPESVLEAMDHCYRHYYANVHRGVHTLSQESTDAYEDARQTVQRFLGAHSATEIVFLRGTTEGINLVAQSWGRQNVGAGDEVLLTTMEHHSNIIPWQLLCKEKGARLRVAPINDRGELLLDDLRALLSERTRIVALAHVSNALGTINPVREITRLAHEAGALVLVDGAQAAPHLPINVQDLDCDFYVYSGHKAFGPSGAGALYARHALLESMPPWQAGGEMIRTVRFDHTEFNDVPHKFEAGTPYIAGAIGLAAAARYLQGIGYDHIHAHERKLLRCAAERLDAIPGVKLIGTAQQKASVLSFVVDGIHAHDIGTVLDQEGVAVRTGHHCAQPVMDHFCVAATARASLVFYNTEEEVERLARGIEKARALFA